MIVSFKIFKFLTLFSLLLLPNCASSQKLKNIEFKISKLQRTYASTNFAIDSTSSKLNLLEKEITRQKQEIANIKE